MKTRNGFVSNSSSSSFIIFGTKTDIWDIEDVSKENVWAIGGPCSEGWDVFKVDPEMLMELRKSENHCNLDLIKAYKTVIIDGPGDSVLIDNNLPPRFDVFSVEKSYHSTSDVKTLKERYFTKFYED